MRGYSNYPTIRHAMAWSPKIKETDMTNTASAQNRALVVEAFDTLFNERNYAGARRVWSGRYIQHSAQIARGRSGQSIADTQRR